MRYLSAALTTIVFILVIVVLVHAAEMKAATAAVPSNPLLLADAYPYFSGLTWGSEHAVIEESLDGYEADSLPMTGVTDVARATQSFMLYYQNKLAAAGWMTDRSRESGGAGGDLVAYVKGNEHIIVGYQSTSASTRSDASPTCPCAVSFLVFSTPRTQ